MIYISGLFCFEKEKAPQVGRTAPALRVLHLIVYPVARLHIPMGHEKHRRSCEDYGHDEKHSGEESSDCGDKCRAEHIEGNNQDDDVEQKHNSVHYNVPNSPVMPDHPGQTYKIKVSEIDLTDFLCNCPKPCPHNI